MHIQTLKHWQPLLPHIETLKLQIVVYINQTSDLYKAYTNGDHIVIR